MDLDFGATFGEREADAGGGWTMSYVAKTSDVSLLVMDVKLWRSVMDEYANQVSSHFKFGFYFLSLALLSRPPPPSLTPQEKIESDDVKFIHENVPALRGASVEGVTSSSLLSLNLTDFRCGRSVAPCADLPRRGRFGPLPSARWRRRAHGRPPPLSLPHSLRATA